MTKIDFKTVLSYIASATVPVGPAFYFGWSFAADIYALVSAIAPSLAPWLAIPVGVSVAVGLESVGMLSGYNVVRAMEASAYWQATAAALSLVAYVTLGILGAEHVWSQIVTVFLIAPAAYAQLGITKSLNRLEEKIDKQELAAADEHNLQAQRDHDFRMAQLNAQKEAKIAGDKARAEADATAAAAVARAKADATIARTELKAKALEISPLPAHSQHTASTQPAHSQHRCQECGRQFRTVQALNAHKRFCSGQDILTDGYVETGNGIGEGKIFS